MLALDPSARPPGEGLFPAPSDDRAGTWIDAALIAVVAFTAHFALAHRFGLYQDDFAFVGKAMGWSWAEAGAELRWCFVEMPLGRPLGFAIGRAASFLLVRAGGLHLAYLGAAAWVAGNALLARTLLSRIQGRTFGLLGGLCFTLFPADTTHPFLTHAFALQPTLTLLLCALLCAQRGRTVLSFGLAACTLFVYETGVLPFALAPLLLAPWDRRLPGRVIRHGLATLAMVAAVFGIRFLVGDGRVRQLPVAELSLPEMVLRSVTTGPFRGLTSFTRRSADGLTAMAGSAALLAAAVAVALVLAVVLAARLRRGAREAPAPVMPWVRMLVAGVALTAVAYCFCFPPHFPPTACDGIATSVHLAAALGAAVAWGAVLWLPLALARRPALRMGAAALVAAFLATLWAFDVTVQQGMVAAAEQGRRRWSEMAALLPDLAPGAVVIALGPREREESRFYESSAPWADSLVLPELFVAAPGDPPVSLVRLVGGPGALDGALREEGGALRWVPDLDVSMAVDRAAVIDPERLVVLERSGDRWTRWTGAFTVHGVAVQLRVPLAPGPRPLGRGPLAGVLLGGEGDAARPAIGAPR